jgi:CIC family chloride channel protein
MMGFVSFIFVRGLYWTEDRFDSMPGNDYTRHISAMLTVGVMIYLMQRWTGYYYVEGVGYATIMDVLRGTLTDPFFLLLLFVLKYAATCLTLGSGGSGGIFSPALFMGATLGAMFGHSAEFLFPGIEIVPESFIAAGMAAGFGGSTGAIITATVMVLEMTEDANAVLPIIITVSIALGVRKWLSPGSIYTLKLSRRGHPVPEGLQAAIDEARTVKDLMATQFRFLESDAVVAPYEGITIVLSKGSIVGLIDVVAFNHADDLPARTLADPNYTLTVEHARLTSALKEMHSKAAVYAVVTRHPGFTGIDDIVGVLTDKEIATFCRLSAKMR